MPNSFFKFKQFVVQQDQCAMKVTTDGCLFGAWVSEVMQKAKAKSKNALDIGTGTGLLSLMIAQKNEVYIEALEIDEAASLQAKANIGLSPWKERIDVIHTDVLHWQTHRKYDWIISNPPFYESELKSDKTTKNIAHHDEGLKLDDLFRFISDHLTDDGSFFLLLPAKRENELGNLFERHQLYLHQKVLVRQSEHHAAFRLMIKGGKETNSTISVDMAIKNKSNEYTPAFIALLKEYYLYL